MPSSTDFAIRFTHRLETAFSKCPKKLEATVVVVCTQGQVRIDVDGVLFKMMPNDMLFCFRQSLVNSVKASPDCVCDVIIVPSHTFDDILFNCVRNTQDLPAKWNFLLRHPMIRLTEQQMRLKYSFTNIISIYRQHGHSTYSKYISRALSEVIIYEVLTWIDVQMEKEPLASSFSRGEITFRRFFNLVQEHHGTIREVQWYAEQLAITPKYLTYLCKRYAQATTLQVITDETVREIRRELLSTDDSVKEIAFRMNFPNLTFFCKYVKQHLGMSPSEVRARYQNEFNLLI